MSTHKSNVEYGMCIALPLWALTTWTFTYIVLVSEISWYEILIWKVIMSTVYNGFCSLYSTTSTSSSSSLQWHHKGNHASTNESTKSTKKPAKKLEAKEALSNKSLFENSEVRSDIWRGMLFVLPRLTNALSLFRDIRTNTIYKKNDVLVLFTFTFVMPLIFP